MPIPAKSTAFIGVIIFVSWSSKKIATVNVIDNPNNLLLVKMFTVEKIVKLTVVMKNPINKTESGPVVKIVKIEISKNNIVTTIQ